MITSRFARRRNEELVNRARRKTTAMINRYVIAMIATTLSGLVLIFPTTSLATSCAVSEKTADGFVSLREGPSSQYKEGGAV